jgi:hypothetical protein
MMPRAVCQCTNQSSKKLKEVTDCHPKTRALVEGLNLLEFFMKARDKMVLRPPRIGGGLSKGRGPGRGEDGERALCKTIQPSGA